MLTWTTFTNKPGRKKGLDETFASRKHREKWISSDNKADQNNNRERAGATTEKGH